ncbi:histone deacetylase family protein [Desulfotalea psychrophila]|uniref:Histone deacetylase domain-containing protein n=1 Tax=Desulfotalea psychrophila (strain LSv54 / DSM 12343) TaxID=177439 RepID=Q6AJC0_DESPS|nr:histone deacetylase [Desulfotalea psychrophila]CAG37560.1 hypothetical protein DP2831 [Desulfotalea psychrophila LSv54]
MISLPLLTVITDFDCLKHDTGGGGHPEVPARLEVILKCLEESPLLPHLKFVASRLARRASLLLAHEEDWLFRFEEAVLFGKSHIDHLDNQIGYHTYQVAALAAGAGLKGIDLLEAGDARQIFCVIRPPGHHAEKGKPFGFCFYNNVLIAARYWQEKYGRRRVAVIDFDAHHGNGIQAGLERDPKSLYISIHEHPSFSYPGTGFAEEIGTGLGKGTILNLPLSPGAGDDQFLAVMRERVEPFLEEWRPDCLLVAAGFDGHRADDMSGLGYSTALFYQIGKQVSSWGKRFAGGRVVSILEGGYELSVLGESVEQYVAGLLACELDI